ncbi:hypothetical protein [Paenibacillus sp. BIHB 4019]|nr:hypothetical protein [Paenibacillus sp. BIHB 4019]
MTNGCLIFHPRNGSFAARGWRQPFTPGLGGLSSSYLPILGDFGG